MTVSELQTMRTNILAAINGSLAAGGTYAYGINGRNLQKMRADELWKMLNEVDSLILAATTGSFYASQFRNPE